jgi:hypothetical protein
MTERSCQQKLGEVRDDLNYCDSLLSKIPSDGGRMDDLKWAVTKLLTSVDKLTECVEGLLPEQKPHVEPIKPKYRNHMYQKRL